jgi:hypothetical protein
MVTSTYVGSSSNSEYAFVTIQSFALPPLNSSQQTPPHSPVTPPPPGIIQTLSTAKLSGSEFSFLCPRGNHDPTPLSVPPNELLRAFVEMPSADAPPPPCPPASEPSPTVPGRGDRACTGDPLAELGTSVAVVGPGDVGACCAVWMGDGGGAFCFAACGGGGGCSSWEDWGDILGGVAGLASACGGSGGWSWRRTHFHIFSRQAR